MANPIDLNKYLKDRNPKAKIVFDFLQDYVNKTYGELPLLSYYSLPSYTFKKLTYVAFGANKNNFSIYFLPHTLLSDFKERFPNLDYGVGCVRVKYNDDKLNSIIQDLIDLYFDNFFKK